MALGMNHDNSLSSGGPGGLKGDALVPQRSDQKPRLTGALCCRACLRMAALLSRVKAALFLRRSL